MPKKTKETIAKGRKLQTIRESMGMSQEELADAVGRQVKTIRDVENGNQALGRGTWTLVEKLKKDNTNHSHRDNGLSVNGNLHVVSNANCASCPKRKAVEKLIMECPEIPADVKVRIYSELNSP